MNRRKRKRRSWFGEAVESIVDGIIYVVTLEWIFSD